MIQNLQNVPIPIRTEPKPKKKKITKIPQSQ